MERTVKTSDLISAFIQKMLDEADGDVEIRRNELAQHFNVVPSQINYVITSRFTPEHGYCIESRRGGGGYIKIRRVTVENMSDIMHIVNSIGDSLTAFDAAVFLKNMELHGYIDAEKHRLIRIAVSDNTLAIAPPEIRDKLRASITKAMLMN